MDAAGQVMLLTGAASGIGAAVAEMFEAAGGRIAAVDVQEIGASDSRLAIRADVSDAAAVEAAFAATRDAFGRIDHVVHCAGQVGRGPLETMRLDEWRGQIAVNLDSAFLIARQAAAPLREARGSMVLVGSPNGMHGGTKASGPAYAAAKAGVINLARYLAKEWAPDVRVNCVVPGTVDTPMLQRLAASEREQLAKSVPIGRLVTAQEAAAAILFLCSAAASGMTGSIMNVSGGRLIV